MRWWRKPRFLFVYPLAVWFVATAHTTELRLILGIGLVLLGEGIRCWANGYVGHVKVNSTSSGDAKIGQLITGGPYAYIRHPLYFGTLLIGAGFCVIVGHVWLSVVAAGLFVWTYQAKMAQEEALLRDEWGEVYARYERAVPRWLPTLHRYAERAGSWSWRGILASKEWKTFVWVVALLILFYLREELWQERQGLLGPHGTKHILLLAIVALLVMTDVLFEVSRQRAKRSAASLS